MKIAFLYPQWTGSYGVFGHFAKRQSTFPPINLALLAAVVERAGHEAIVIDGEAEGLPESQMLERALASGADLFGLTCYSPFSHLNVSLAKKIKDTGCKTPIIVGGPHATIMKEKFLLPEFDYVFQGEAEDSLPQFMDVYGKGGDLSQVEGIIFRNGDEICIGQARWVEGTVKIKGSNLGKEYILDQFPLPNRQLLPMDSYKIGTVNGRSHFTSIQTMRGCPWKCIFCASEALNTTTMRMRSPRSIVDEIRQVVTEFPQISHFYFVDDVLTLFDDHIIEICNLIIQEGLKITFEGSTRANLVKDDVMALMARAGLIRISFGLETVDTEMRKTMKKKVPLEAYTEANRICNKYSVEALNSVMIGLPGESRKTVETTLQWLVNNRDVTQSNFAVAIPYPGTELSDMAMAGTNGIELVAKDGDFSNYLRYGSAVTKVGDLSPEDLVELQNEAFLRFYSKTWRWPAMFRKHGFMGFVLLGLRFYRAWKSKLSRKWLQPVYNHPKDF